MKRIYILFILIAHSAYGFSLIGHSNDYPATIYDGLSIDGVTVSMQSSYRWCIPIITYGYTPLFYNSFGVTMVDKIDEAVNSINNIGYVSGVNLNNIPVDTTRSNYRARALNIVDINSQAFTLLLTALGLSNPHLSQLYYDPITWNQTAILTGNPNAGMVLTPGTFLNGITRDDLAGLRYLYNEYNQRYETLPNDCVAYYATNNLQVDAIRPGIENITLQRLDDDFMWGENSYTYNYEDSYIVSTETKHQTVTRRVYSPDIVFTAGDLGFENGSPVVVKVEGISRWKNGQISPQIYITFNNVVLCYNEGNNITETTGKYLLLYGGFNGTTNAPIIGNIAESNKDTELSIRLKNRIVWDSVFIKNTITTSIKRTGNSFEWIFKGNSSFSKYHIFGSKDLINWIPVGEALAVNGTFKCILPISLSQRYYRASVLAIDTFNEMWK
jgi:hypothetical protein